MSNFDGAATPTKAADVYAGLSESNYESPSKYEETLVDTSRRSWQTPAGVWIDNGASISEDLAYQVHTKACKLQTVFLKKRQEDRYEGQVGFIRTKYNAEGDVTTCTPVTAFHNITETQDCRYSRSVALLADCAAEMDFAEADRPLSSLATIDLAPDGSDVSYPWNHGIDIAWGDHIPLEDNDLVSSNIESQSFDPIREGFTLRKGLKIGIAIYSDTGATAAGARTKVEQKQLDVIFGPPQHIHIYTGTITHVGKHHIEYDINVFKGCSGAIVFLLDRGQPEGSGVASLDYGKAVAVHAGSHPYKVKNIAFKLSAKPVQAM